MPLDIKDINILETENAKITQEQLLTRELLSVAVFFNLSSAT